MNGGRSQNETASAARNVTRQPARFVGQSNNSACLLCEKLCQAKIKARFETLQPCYALVPLNGSRVSEFLPTPCALAPVQSASDRNAAGRVGQSTWSARSGSMDQSAVWRGEIRADHSEPTGARKQDCSSVAQTTLSFEAGYNLRGRVVGRGS